MRAGLRLCGDEASDYYLAKWMKQQAGECSSTPIEVGLDGSSESQGIEMSSDEDEPPLFNGGKALCVDRL